MSQLLLQESACPAQSCMTANARPRRPAPRRRPRTRTAHRPRRCTRCTAWSPSRTGPTTACAAAPGPARSARTDGRHPRADRPPTPSAQSDLPIIGSGNRMNPRSRVGTARGAPLGASDPGCPLQPGAELTSSNRTASTATSRWRLPARTIRAARVTTNPDGADAFDLDCVDSYGSGRGYLGAWLGLLARGPKTAAAMAVRSGSSGARGPECLPWPPSPLLPLPPLPSAAMLLPPPPLPLLLPLPLLPPLRPPLPSPPMPPAGMSAPAGRRELARP